jgi:hypothetical protein
MVVVPAKPWTWARLSGVSRAASAGTRRSPCHRPVCSQRTQVVVSRPSGVSSKVRAHTPW